ncbi:MAG: caspase family protein [Hyphomicrobium sp.]
MLLSIGCNAYQHVDGLGSAEKDAQSIFHALTSGAASIYDPKNSTLLLSPNRADIEASILGMLKHHKGADVFTFYFAGHGTIQDGSFYLCPCDASVDAISVTGINITTILRAVCELKPRQAYLIIDACNSGGSALDLTAVLRPEIIAQSPAFGISVMASAHVAELAIEDAGGGLFTQKLLLALNGSLVVNDTVPFLGLGEIVRKLPYDGSIDLGPQGPNFWDLNLTGADTFCRNPAFTANGQTHNTDFGTLRFQQSNNLIDPALAAEIWRKFLDLPQFEFEGLHSLFERLVDRMLIDLPAIPSSAESIARSFAAGVAANSDTFSEVQVRAAMIRALMPHISKDDNIRAAIDMQVDAVVTAVRAALKELSQTIDADRYALLSRCGGYSDLYYLPIRVAQVLGWIGFLSLTEQSYGFSSNAALNLKELSSKILNIYGNSIVTVGEDQAPHFLTFLVASKASGWVEQGEEVVGRLYLNFNENLGRVLPNDPPPSDIFEYLILRIAQPPDCTASFLQSPSELFSVVLLGASMFNLDEEIDSSLIQLDHTHFVFYVPDTYSDFWQGTMETGRNIVSQLGHRVWSVNDVRRTWRDYVLGLVQAALPVKDREVELSALALSLIMPDRLPLYIVPDIPLLPDTRITIA